MKATSFKVLRVGARRQVLARSRPPSPRPATRRRAPLRPPSVPVKRTGRPSRPQPSPPIGWLLALAAGAVVLALAAVFTIRCVKPPKPTATPVQPAAPTATSTLASSAALETAASPVPTTATPSAALAPDIPALQQLMWNLINQDREANGLAPVLWDRTAAAAGLSHAVEMAQYAYISHWNLEGQGPDYRYSLAGGLDHVRENVYCYQHSPGAGPDSREAWETLMRHAQQSLMDSPGHRENILAAEHTHVGIGIAYNPSHGYLAIAQEFVDHYATLDPLPLRGSVGQTITLAGRLEGGASSPLINLAYEAFPGIKSVDELRATGVYQSPAEVYGVIPLSSDADGRFSKVLQLDNAGKAGLYHVRLWVETKFGDTLAADVVIVVH